MNTLLCILSAILLLCVSSIFGGGCLTDGDTAHVAADYNQRLYSYTSRYPVQPSTSSDLKFITFNIQSGFHYNCVNNVTAQALLMRQADYTGNQEAVQGVDTRCSRCSIPSVVADVAGMSTRFVMAMPYRTGQYGTNLGTSQIILDTKYILMTISGVEPRVAVAVKTQPLALKGRYLWYVNVHVEFYSSAARQSQVAQVLSFIQTQILNSDPSAVIVMGGDFNGGPWDAMYTTIKNAGFKNSWEVFHGSINDGNTIPADWPGSRFDHIWYRVPSDVYVTVKSAEVVNVMYSDHRPYRTTLGFSVGTPVNNPTPATPAPTPATPRPTTAPPNSATTKPNNMVCVGPILENNQVTISCPVPTQKMTTVQFASYGNPSGSCGNFKLGNCVGGSSVAVVTDKCLGRSSCSFPIANNVFGDPCPKNGKHFMAQVVCN